MEETGNEEVSTSILTLTHIRGPHRGEELLELVLLPLLGGQDHHREVLVELFFLQTVKAATLHVLNRTTLPRPPDPRAKCYLSGAGADDIRPTLFQALPC